MNTKIGLLKLDHREAEFYEFHLPKENNSKRHHHKDNWKLVKKIEPVLNAKGIANEANYFKTLAKITSYFDVLVMASHGKGHADKGECFQSYLSKHNKSLRDIIIGHVTTHNHRTQNQLLEEADIILQNLEVIP